MSKKNENQVEEKRKKATEEELPSGVVLREHVYDGIQEYDQRLPNWWLFTFYIMIVFFVFYWVAYYQFGALASDEERLDAKMAKIREAQNETMMAMLNDEGLWDMSRDEAIVAEGKGIYLRNCMACHAENLQGKSIGPQYIGQDLTDGTWIHGGNPTQVFKVVHDGVIEKGMLPWGQVMGPEGVAKVVSFILSHHEVSPPGEGPPPTPEEPVGSAGVPAPPGE